MWSGCVFLGMCVCVCVCVCAFMCVSGFEVHPQCAVCLRGIGGDPGATGIHNRPAGPSLCDDKALGVLRKRPCVRPHAGVYVSQQAALHRNTGSMRAERVSLTASDSRSRERAVR